MNNTIQSSMLIKLLDILLIGKFSLSILSIAAAILLVLLIEEQVHNEFTTVLLDCLFTNE